MVVVVVVIVVVVVVVVLVVVVGVVGGCSWFGGCGGCGGSGRGGWVATMTLMVMVVQPVTVVPVTVVLQRSLVLAACHALGSFVAAACPVVPVAVVLLPVPVAYRAALASVNCCRTFFVKSWNFFSSSFVSSCNFVLDSSNFFVNSWN